MSAAAPREWPPALLNAARLVTFAVVCGVLYWGQVVLIPIALAALVAFLASPLVTRLDRLHVPRVLGVIVVLACVTGVLAGLGYVVVGQLGSLAAELPAHRQNVRAKVRDLRDFLRGGTLEQVQTTIEDISEDVESVTAPAETQAPASPAASPPTNRRLDGSAPDDGEQPVRVEVVPERQLLGNSRLWSPALQGVATAGLSLLLAVFMLIGREDLRNRIVSLAGQTSLAVTTKAFADAGRRISRYLLMQFIINATMGLAVGLGLFFIGVPYAALWGLAAAIFRYVPYIGPWIAAALPILVSLITAPGWEQVVLVVSLFIVLELLSNNVMEPWLYGQSVGLSALAVIVSAIFWTWLWGPVGLVLATPITACLVVLSRYIPGLAVFDRLLSERPALQPHLTLYQRLLARDDDEAEDIVEAHLEEHSLVETCDELLLGTLAVLKRDLAEGRITREEGEFAVSALREIIDDLPSPPRSDDAPTPRRSGDPVPLIGFPVRDEVEETALQLLGVLLRNEHCELRTLSPDTLIGERMAEVEKRKPAAVCIASLPPGDLTALRHVCKRLHTRLPDLKLVVGRLGAPKATARSEELLRAAGAQLVVPTLAELSEAVQRLARELQPAAGRSAAAEEDAPSSTREPVPAV
jgi:predicted PurR-regulated permease PerM